MQPGCPQTKVLVAHIYDVISFVYQCKLFFYYPKKNLYAFLLINKIKHKNKYIYNYIYGYVQTKIWELIVISSGIKVT